MVVFFVPALFFLQGHGGATFLQLWLVTDSVVVNMDSGSFPFLRFKICNRLSFSAQGHDASLLCRRNKQDFFSQRSRVLFVFVQPSQAVSSLHLDPGQTNP